MQDTRLERSIGLLGATAIGVGAIVGGGILARRRGNKGTTTFRTPWFPLVQVTGACTCLALAIFQGIMVPAAGVLVGLWLGLGGIVYVGLLARRARVFDASVQAQDPYLVQMRGRSPLVLVPIANPANAEAMVAVANALAPPRVGRVLLLSVVNQPDHWEPGEPPPPWLPDGEVTTCYAQGCLAACVEQGRTRA
jgi:hypothetical protein